MDKYGKQRLRPPLCGHSERHGGKLYAPRKPDSSNATEGAQALHSAQQPQWRTRKHTAPALFCCVYPHNLQGICKKTLPRMSQANSLHQQFSITDSTQLADEAQECGYLPGKNILLQIYFFCY